MHNVHRGEVTIEFSSQSLTLRPTFQALCEIESILGKSIVKALIDFEQEQLRLVSIIAIIKAGVKAYDGTILIDEQVGVLIQEKGLMNILSYMVLFLSRAIGLEKDSV